MTRKKNKHHSDSQGAAHPDVSDITPTAADSSAANNTSEIPYQDAPQFNRSPSSTHIDLPEDDTRIDREQQAWRDEAEVHSPHNDHPEDDVYPTPRRYEEADDDAEDDADHYDYSEHSPLMHAESQDADPPKTWLEWALRNGLHPRTWGLQTYIKAALLATLLTLIILSFTVFRVQDHIKDVLRYIDEHKRIGTVLFVLSYTVACTLFLPGSLFTIGAGFLFKPFPIALAVVLMGDAFAAAVSFVFGRYVFYDWVKGMMAKHPKFNALDQVIQDDGWKIVVMLRLTPVPFSLITYFFSITSIQLVTVIWATCVGVLPGSCIGIWIGSLLKGLSGIDNPELERKNVVILVMNGIFIACCVLTLSIFGKRSLRKAMRRLDQHQALTDLREVEVVVEGVASVIRELEDSASIPPSLRSTMIDQLAEEEADPEFYSRQDLEAARRRLLEEGGEGGEREDSDDGGSGTRPTGLDRRLHQRHFNNNNNDNSHHGNTHKTRASELAAGGGFTRGEKITFVVIAAVALLNVCVCVPLYYRFAREDQRDDD
ncbi:hypothetical protein BGZ98_005154 [Dissophora globulifera]|nr:hypothetical protein BGZ98_005154 [Dissophora globulifera]